MKIKSIKNIKFLLAFTACLAQASEPLNQKTWFSQAIDSIGQSSFMHAYSKHVQTKIDSVMHSIQNYGDQPASSRYQELGSQAQCALCTPQEHHLPVKKFNETSRVATLFPAVAESDAIYANENMLDKKTYGSQRSTMFHEATHTKYHDSAVGGILKQAGFWGGTIGTYSALKYCNVVRLRKSLSCTAGLTLMLYTAIKYKYFMEHRADIQGHYATQCSSCVNEEIENRKLLLKENHNACKELHAVSPTIAQFLDKPELPYGYLTRAELQQIAQDLGDKKCAYHSDQK